MDEVTVREIMDREYVGVSESDDLAGTVELLLDEDKETAVVLRGSELVGMLGERDVLALLVDEQPLSAATVGDAMTEDVLTVPPAETVSEAVDRLSAASARRLLVTNGEEPLGVVTEGDLLARQNRPEQGSKTPAQTEMAATQQEMTATENATRANSDEPFEDQGICEVCGSLARELVSFNGQLLCVDCREM